ncbi:MAG: DUF2007 domain-containing protein [Methylophilaceae bacterium]|nr:DUF2007 domain-containing protein [Methylophilaceae bacterium]MDG1821624.1 DUF2007 domain-containing protein [Methylophilaceae bacterium]MDG2292854.1 DUF2007 domain-containing protein [Methylophilaceae bacterium]
MVIIYHAANSLDANMIKGLLEQCEIQAFIQGEYLQGGAGELPAANLVTVSVINSHEIEAKQIIAAWHSAPIIEEETITPLGDGLNVAF